jgi:hypothetical protein
VGNMEIIRDGDRELAYVISREWIPETTQFLTPGDFGQQMGMIVCSADQRIQPHVHLPVVREVHGTTECVIVRRGSCEMDIYDSRRTFITSRHLNAGDIALLISGGHGFRMSEDTVLFEIKQGPYMGSLDKERF